MTWGDVNVTQQCYASMLRINVEMNMGELGKLEKTQNCIVGGGDRWRPSFTSYHLVGHLGWQPESILCKNARSIRFVLFRKNSNVGGAGFSILHLWWFFPWHQKWRIRLNELLLTWQVIFIFNISEKIECHFAAMFCFGWIVLTSTLIA